MMGNTNWLNSIDKTGKGKKGWYKGYYFSSSWELAWIVYNLENDIKFKRNNEKFEYYFEDVKRYYIPDFIINGKYVEIKGYYSEQFKAKLKYFPYEIEVLYKNEIDFYIKYVKNKYTLKFVDVLKE